MFCKNCGAAVHESDVFCTKCGSRIEPIRLESDNHSKTLAPEIKAQAETPLENESNNKQSKKHEKLITVTASIIVVLALAVAGFLGFYIAPRQNAADEKITEIVKNNEVINLVTESELRQNGEKVYRIITITVKSKDIVHIMEGFLVYDKDGGPIYSEFLDDNYIDNYKYLINNERDTLTEKTYKDSLYSLKHDFWGNVILKSDEGFGVFDNNKVKTDERYQITLIEINNEERVVNDDDLIEDWEYYLEYCETQE